MGIKKKHCTYKYSIIQPQQFHEIFGSFGVFLFFVPLERNHKTQKMSGDQQGVTCFSCFTAQLMFPLACFEKPQPISCEFSAEEFTIIVCFVDIG